MTLIQDTPGRNRQIAMEGHHHTSASSHQHEPGVCWCFLHWPDLQEFISHILLLNTLISRMKYLSVCVW